MCTRTYYSLWVLAFCVMGGVSADADVIWDFENGNDHGFALTSINPATPVIKPSPAPRRPLAPSAFTMMPL